MIGEPVTDAQLNQVLALGDIDHDGRIDYEGMNTLQPKSRIVDDITFKKILEFITKVVMVWWLSLQT